MRDGGLVIGCTPVDSVSGLLFEGFFFKGGGRGRGARAFCEGVRFAPANLTAADTELIDTKLFLVAFLYA